MPLYQCFLPIAKKMGIPVIGTLSYRSLSEVDIVLGNPRNPSVFGAEFFYVDTKISLLRRLMNLFYYIQIRILSIIGDRRAIKFCNNELPGQESHKVEISLVFVNTHVTLDARPLVPNVVNVGGIVIKSAKLHPLPQQLKKFIDEAPHGVILFSLGTLVSDDAGDSHSISTLIKTFSKISQRVIWKHGETIDGLSDNVWLSRWLPQKEILAHKNVVAFISHCGLSSTQEAIYFGKPMILLPIFVDQPSNAALLENLGVGIYINILELTEANLLEAIEEVVNNKTYRINMEQLSRKFKDQPKSPGELVVFWTEYVLKHKGATYLRAVTADMPLYQYLLLDVIAFITVVSILVVSFVYFATKYL